MINVVNVPSTKSALKYVVDFCKGRLDEDIQIIVPDKLSLFMERYLFDSLDISSSFNLKVSTLNRFVKRKNPLPPEMQISKTGSVILIHKILNELGNTLKVMQNKAYSFTYAENIYNTIAQLKSSKITSDEMLSFVSDNVALMDKIHDLGIIFERYERDKAGLLDLSDSFLSSAMFIGDELTSSTIIVVGFEDFTAIEYTLLERIANNAQDLYVMNLASKSTNKYIYNHEVLSQLKSIAYINELGYEVIDEIKADDDITSYLEQNLFGLTPSKFLLTKNSVKVFTGNSIEDELEFVARDIREKILSGYKGGECGVAIFNLDNTYKFAEEIFAKYDINYYIDSQFTINNSIYFKFIGSLLKYLLEGYEHTHLIDIINSPFIKIDIKDKQTIIEKLLVYKYRGRLDKLDVGEESSPIKSLLIQMLNVFDIHKDSKLDEFIEKLKALNIHLDMSATLHYLSENLVDVREKVLLSKSIENVFKILDEIKRFYPNAEMGEVYDIIFKVARTMKINNLPLTVNAVKIIDAENVLEIFDCLYIVNANSDNAPSMKYDCGIILDSEIEVLNFKHKLSPTIAFINRLSKLRLFNSALMFGKHLTLTYSKRPSILIQDVLGRFDTKIGDRLIDIEPINKYVLDNRPLSQWDYIEKKCKNKMFSSKNCKKIAKNSKNLANLIKNTEKITSLNNDNLKLYDDICTISASTLENYFKCPFYAFINNTLKIKPRLDGEIQSLDVGNILHELIYKYYISNKEVGDVREFCVREIHSYIEHNERLRLNKSSPIITNLIDESVRVIAGLNYIDENTDFVPTHFEYSFKDKSFDNKVSLVGKVDRIDVSSTGIRVVDYKSGRAEASLKELYYGNKLQLFMYSKAVERVLNQLSVGNFYLPLHNKYDISEEDNPYMLKGFFVNDEKVVHALDTRLSPGEKSDIVNLKMNNSGLAYRYGKAIEEQEYHALKNYSYEVSKIALREMMSGYISPSPSDVSKPCNYCPYKHICMKNSNGIVERSVKKVNLDSFKENL